MDEAETNVPCERQISKVARPCVRCRVMESEVVDQEGHVPRPIKESWIGNCHTEEAGGLVAEVVFVQEKSPTMDSPTYEGSCHLCKSHGDGKKDAETLSKKSMNVMDKGNMSLSESRRGARHGSQTQTTTMAQQLVAGCDGTANAWLVQEGDRPLGQEISEEEDLEGKERAPEGKLKEPETRKKSMVGSYVQHDISNGVIDSRWGWIGMLVDGVQKGALPSSMNRRKIWRLDIQQEPLLLCHLWNQALSKEQADPPVVGLTQAHYLRFIFQGKTPMLGTLPVHYVDILGCGELGGMTKPRQSLPPPVALKLCQGKLGEVCWFAMVLRPEFCARRVRQASRKQSTKLKYESPLVWDDPQGKPRLWDLSSHIPIMM